jgi:hypothetical protein
MGSGSPPTWDGGARNMPAADYFVGLCDAVLGLRCAIAISEYYGDRRKESAEAEGQVGVLGPRGRERDVQDLHRPPSAAQQAS